MPNEEDKKVGEDDESTVDTTPDDNPLTDEEKGDGLDTEDKEEKFMNPNELPPELKPAFKKMQASFTRAMQMLSGERDKVELANKLLENPKEALRLLSERVGVPLATEKPADSSTSDTEKWVQERALAAIQPMLKQLGSELASVKVQLAETYLTNMHPDWYLYENEMAGLIKQHPSLATDLDKLYDLAKHGYDEAALLKKQGGKTSRIASKPSGSKHIVPDVAKAKNLDEAIEIAKRQHGIK